MGMGSFFENRDGRLLHAPTAPLNYWGAQWVEDYRWGTLVYNSVDSEWAVDITAFVTETVAKLYANHLGDALRTAFHFALPVTLEDQAKFSWELVSAVVPGEKSPIEAAQQWYEIVWFIQD